MVFVKDFLTKQVLLRCDSSSDLYPITSSSPQNFAVVISLFGVIALFIPMLMYLSLYFLVNLLNIIKLSLMFFVQHVKRENLFDFHLVLLSLFFFSF